MSKVSKVSINVLPSSVIFSQGKREVTVGKNHLPLISGVISAVYTAKSCGLAPMGIARNKAFTSLAIPAGYKGRDKLLGCAKDSASLAAGKKLVARNGSLFKNSDDFRDIALAVVKFVNDSKDFKKVKVKTTKTGVKAKKGNNNKKFRVTEDGKLERLSRGKPSPFWTIVEAPENAQGSDAYGENGKIAKGFKVLRKASEKTERVTKTRKAANSKQILALEAEVTELRETLAKILAVVEGNAKLLESLNKPAKTTKVRKAKDSKKLSKDSTMTEVAEIVKERVAKKNPNLVKDSAKMEAMSDLVNDNAEMANIVTQL
jgi:hypothetical protein